MDGPVLPAQAGKRDLEELRLERFEEEISADVRRSFHDLAWSGGGGMLKPLETRRKVPFVLNPSYQTELLTEVWRSWPLPGVGLDS